MQREGWQESKFWRFTIELQSLWDPCQAPIEDCSLEGELSLLCRQITLDKSTAAKASRKLRIDDSRPFTCFFMFQFPSYLSLAQNLNVVALFMSIKRKHVDVTGAGPCPYLQGSAFITWAEHQNYIILMWQNLRPVKVTQKEWFLDTAQDMGQNGFHWMHRPVPEALDHLLGSRCHGFNQRFHRVKTLSPSNLFLLFFRPRFVKVNGKLSASWYQAKSALKLWNYTGNFKSQTWKTTNGWICETQMFNTNLLRAFARAFGPSAAVPCTA